MTCQRRIVWPDGSTRTVRNMRAALRIIARRNLDATIETVCTCATRARRRKRRSP